jgi:hypothetical protein
VVCREQVSLYCVNIELLDGQAFLTSGVMDEMGCIGSGVGFEIRIDGVMHWHV